MLFVVFYLCCCERGPCFVTRGAVIVVVREGDAAAGSWFLCCCCLCDGVWLRRAAVWFFVASCMVVLAMALEWFADLPACVAGFEGVGVRRQHSLARARRSAARRACSLATTHASNNPQQRTASTAAALMIGLALGAPRRRARPGIISTFTSAVDEEFTAAYAITAQNNFDPIPTDCRQRLRPRRPASRRSRACAPATRGSSVDHAGNRRGRPDRAGDHAEVAGRLAGGARQPRRRRRARRRRLCQGPPPPGRLAGERR